MLYRSLSPAPILDTMVQKQNLSTCVGEQSLQYTSPFSHGHRYNPSSIVARHKVKELVNYSFTEKTLCGGDISFMGVSCGKANMLSVSDWSVACEVAGSEMCLVG